MVRVRSLCCLGLVISSAIIGTFLQLANTGLRTQLRTESNPPMRADYLLQTALVTGLNLGYSQNWTKYLCYRYTLNRSGVLDNLRRQQRTGSGDNSTLQISHQTEKCVISSNQDHATRNLVILTWNTRKWFRMTGAVILPDDDENEDVMNVAMCQKDQRQIARTCTFTEDRSEYSRSAAVLILGDVALFPRDFPLRRRLKNQKWIYYSRESPGMNVYFGSRYSRLRRQVSLYNLTSTYSLQSDIPHPYTDEICGDGNASIPDWVELSGAEESELRSIVSNKSAAVAWFVSHCQTASRREQYVAELRRHITVDVFGKCRPHFHQQQQTVSQSECAYDVHAARPWASCDDSLLQRHYKFYLSFENSLCLDYVTEKFFRLLHLDVVPVVLGSAHYEQFSPRGTFVDVRQFASARQLADHLRRLDDDDELYRRLLRRKRRLTCRHWSRFADYRHRLCHYLHTHQATTQTTNIQDIIDPRRACTPARQFYANISDVAFARR